MTKPRAVVDVVGTETRADQFLEEIRLFVSALGRAEAGDGVATIFRIDLRQAFDGKIEGFLPARLAEMSVAG